MPRMLRLIVALMVGVFAANGTLADVTGEFQSGGKATYKIEYRDDRNFRISFAQGGAMMINGTYFILQTLGTKTFAMDKAAIRKTMTKYKTKDTNKPKTIIPKVSFTPLNRTETIAGIEGQVFEVISTYADGRTTQEEAVLSEDKRVVGLQRAMVILAEEGRKMMAEMGQASQPNPFDAMGNFKNKGVLRYGRLIKLISLHDRKIATDRFVRPPLMKTN